MPGTSWRTTEKTSSIEPSGLFTAFAPTCHVDHEPRLHAVGSEKDCIAVKEELGYGGIHDVPKDRVIADRWASYPSNSFGDLNFGPCGAAEQAREPA